MTVLDRLLAHDAWTTRQLLLRCRELSDEQMNREFDIGDKSLSATFVHIIGCMEKHTDLMLERNSDQIGRNDNSIVGLLARLTTVAKDFSEFASIVDCEGSADEMCVSAERGEKWPKGSLIAHIITHSMHHRAQIMYMMERSGIQDVIEGDALAWEGQARGWGYQWCDSYGNVVVE